MKRLLFLLLLISTPVLCVTYNAEVIRVIDGDSVHLRDGDGLRHKVRLFGIDSPEMRQKYGAKAGRYLASRIGGEFVTATVVDRDAYQREVVILYDSNMINMNEEMVRLGFAWAYRRYLTDDFQHWIELEADAKRQRFGLWSKKNPVPPWDFRKANRSR